MREWLIVGLLAVLLGGGCSPAPPAPSYGCQPRPKRPQVDLPIEFDVADSSRFYFFGERVLHVRLSTAPGESLYLNGVPILPRAHRPVPWEEPTPSDEDYLRWYGSAPFVQDLLAAGASAADAAHTYTTRQERIYLGLQHAYAEASEAGQDDPTASAAAVARLEEFDTDALLDPARPARSTERGVVLFWDGFEDLASVQFESPLDVRDVMAPDEADKRSRATSLYYDLTDNIPCFLYMGLGGVHETWGRGSVRRIERELQNVLSSQQLGEVYFLNELAVREILLTSIKRRGLPN